MSHCIQYLSDIHLEFYRGSIPKVDRLLRQIVHVAPLCALAGDIGYPGELAKPNYQVWRLI